MKHQSALVLETTDPNSEEQKNQVAKGKFNPVLTQNARHQNVQEMREKRLKEQQMRNQQNKNDTQQQIAASAFNYTQKERNRSRQHQHR